MLHFTKFLRVVFVSFFAPNIAQRSIAKEIIGHFSSNNGLAVDGWEDFTTIPDPTASASDNGTLIEWRVRLYNPTLSNLTSKLVLQIWRPVETADRTYTLINDFYVSEFVPLESLILEKVYKVEIEIQQGDVIGLRNDRPTHPVLTYKILSTCEDKRNVLYTRPTNPTLVGEQAAFDLLTSQPCRNYAFEALLLRDDDSCGPLSNRSRKHSTKCCVNMLNDLFANVTNSNNTPSYDDHHSVCRKYRTALTELTSYCFNNGSLIESARDNFLHIKRLCEGFELCENGGSVLDRNLGCKCLVGYGGDYCQIYAPLPFITSDSLTAMAIGLAVGLCCLMAVVGGCTAMVFVSKYLKSICEKTIPGKVNRIGVNFA